MVGCLIDFKFIPDFEYGGKDLEVTLEALVRYIKDPTWCPSHSCILVLMFIVCTLNFGGAIFFMSYLCARVWTNISLCFPITSPIQWKSFQRLPMCIIVETIRICIHGFLVNKKTPQPKKFHGAFLPPCLPRYFVKNNLWVVCLCELYKGELCMEAYFRFLDNQGGRGIFFINFGGIKPFVAWLVSSFLHTRTPFVFVFAKIYVY